MERFTLFAPMMAGMPCCPNRTAAGACFSADRRERFSLWRRWSDHPLLGFVLMNPSIADEDRLDPTLKRCAGWAQRLGYGGMEIVNVFPLVSTDPRGLADHDHAPSRQQNASHIRDLATRTTLIVGFGDLLSSSWLRALALPALSEIADALGGVPVYALAVTENGSPRHPLARGKHHIPSVANPVLYDLAELTGRGADLDRTTNTVLG